MGRWGKKLMTLQFVSWTMFGSTTQHASKIVFFTFENLLTANIKRLGNRIIQVKMVQTAVAALPEHKGAQRYSKGKQGSGNLTGFVSFNVNNQWWISCSFHQDGSAVLVHVVAELHAVHLGQQWLLHLDR